MALTAETQTLRDRYVQILFNSTRPLQEGPDREASLEALIEAAGVLRDRLKTELTELTELRREWAN